jgi:hypothetical protein
MSKNTINGLRDVLFETLQELRDKESPMDLDRAKMIVETGQVIINSAKVEIDYLRATNQTQGTGFIQIEPAPGNLFLPNAQPPAGSPVVQKTGTGTATVTPVTGGRIVTHKAS